MPLHINTPHASAPEKSGSSEKAAPVYSIADIVACMRHAALMLWMADHDNKNRELAKLNQSQARLLEVAANDLELRGE